jgi:hypothetical protein
MEAVAIKAGQEDKEAQDKAKREAEIDAWRKEAQEKLEAHR